MSSDGYIIHQGLLGHIPYARRDSAYCGCGWIAAYNLLRCCGCGQPWDDVRRALEKGVFLGGRFGTNPFAVRRYLRRFLSVSVTCRGKEAEKRAAAAKAGILLYWHGAGAHFVMFSNLGNGFFRFRNAIYGLSRYDRSMNGFLKYHSKSPFIWCLTAAR